MSDIIIRGANLNDLPTLLEFEQHIITAERPYDNHLKDDPISYYDLKELILSEKAEVLVAEVSNEIVGSGYAQIKESKPYMKHDLHSYLGFMYVAPNYRGKGINKLILNALQAWSKAQNVYHCILDVYSGNQLAIRAYEKVGFKSNLIEMCVSLDETHT
ncbi:MAG: GNAT family N-acetyltransferase [Colwellia sp.]|nr:GNAT family N-acetyltransferase [Colwellia sp.]MCW8864137.1 GNAT family N-acetyltransferase [Colwellia sp.]MCW9083164.1 GNAT family N-acetyltransferase [Colwellia sp.]